MCLMMLRSKEIYTAYGRYGLQNILTEALQPPIPAAKTGML